MQHSLKLIVFIFNKYSFIQILYTALYFYTHAWEAGLSFSQKNHSLVEVRTLSPFLPDLFPVTVWITVRSADRAYMSWVTLTTSKRQVQIAIRVGPTVHWQLIVKNITQVSENKATPFKKTTGNTASENSNTEVLCAKTKPRAYL